MLPDRCETLWQNYLATEKVRIRSESNAALLEFVEGMKEAPTDACDRWVRDLSARVIDQKDQTVVRLPLFREVIFPSLLRGYRERVPGCARWLSGFSQLLYKSPACLEQLHESERSEYGLLLRAVEADPNDCIARERLVRILRSRFEYALHELPAGVLYAQDGATPEQCDEMEVELRFFEGLARECGTQHEDAVLLEEARFHIAAYREYLRSRNAGDSYEGYLELKKKKDGAQPGATDNPDGVQRLREDH